MLRRMLTAVALGVVLMAGSSSCGDSGGSQAGGSGLGSEPDTTVAGTWRPLMITGYQLPAEYPDGLRTATVTFDGAGGWRGSDGCNGLTGNYRFHADGRMEATVGPQTLIGCANVPNGRVLAQAARARLDGAALTFLDGNGQVLGRYERVPTEAAPAG